MDTNDRVVHKESDRKGVIEATTESTAAVRYDDDPDGPVHWHNIEDLQLSK